MPPAGIFEPQGPRLRAVIAEQATQSDTIVVSQVQGPTETSHLSANFASRKDSNSFYADKLSDLRRKI